MNNNGDFNRREFIGLATLAAAGATLPRALRADPPQNALLDTVLEKGRYDVSNEVVPWRILPFPNQ